MLKLILKLLGHNDIILIVSKNNIRQHCYLNGNPTKLTEMLSIEIIKNPTFKELLSGALLKQTEDMMEQK